jgi:ADP-heptose:LPS heptosyltransferase
MKFWYKSGAWASKAAWRKLAALTPAGARRIAVIRHAALGDMVLTRPFLSELRKHFPNASITLSLVSNYVHGAPEDLVDRVHVVYGSDRRDVSRWEQLRRARELGYQDLLFDLAATPRSFWLSVLNRAYLKVGFPYRAIQRWLFYDAAVWRSDLRFEAEAMLEMLNLIGIRTEYPPRFDLPGTATRRARPCVVYFPSASEPSKCWPTERFAELIGRMARDYPAYDHLVLEGRAAWESIDGLLEAVGDVANVQPVRNAGLADTIALLKAARLVVSNDTGIRNLAIAAETPTVGIFFSTYPFRYWPRGPKHDAVFTPDGSLPTVAAVYESARKVIAAGA